MTIQVVFCALLSIIDREPIPVDGRAGVTTVPSPDRQTGYLHGPLSSNVAVTAEVTYGSDPRYDVKRQGCARETSDSSSERLYGDP